MWAAAHVCDLHKNFFSKHKTSGPLEPPLPPPYPRTQAPWKPLLMSPLINVTFALAAYNFSFGDKWRENTASSGRGQRSTDNKLLIYESRKEAERVPVRRRRHFGAAAALHSGGGSPGSQV